MAFTQEELAERAGISPRAIRALERGERSKPYRSTVELLADALDLSPSDRAAFSQLGRSRRRGLRGDQSATSWDGANRGLPAPLTKLIAREREASEILNILTAGESRLLVLSGPGGVGKTPVGD